MKCSHDRSEEIRRQTSTSTFPLSSTCAAHLNRDSFEFFFLPHCPSGTLTLSDVSIPKFLYLSDHMESNDFVSVLAPELNFRPISVLRPTTSQDVAV